MMDFHNNFFVPRNSIIVLWLAYCVALVPAFLNHTTLIFWNSRPVESLCVGQRVQRYKQTLIRWCCCM